MKEKTSTKTIPLIGVWKLLSFEGRYEGEEPFPIFGRDVRGLLIYTDAGLFSAQIMRSNLPKLASGDQLKGTAEEINECFKGCISYFGGYEFDAKGGFVIYHVESSLFPNWEGTTQKRFVEISDKRMSLTTPPASWNGRMGIASLIWERI